MNARVSGISSMATRSVLEELCSAWRRSGRGDVAFVSVGGVEAVKRVLEGEAFDVVVLASDAIDKLLAAGRIAAGSKADLVRSDVAVAVRSGDPRPGIATEQALRVAVLAARRIGYSTGPSGTALLELLGRWGIVDALRDRLVQAPTGVPVGSLLACGEVALGFQQLSELIHFEGVDVLGAMPPGLGIVTTFSGAIGAASPRADAARAFLDFVGSPDADDAKRRHGMTPARRETT